jgi:hypothetical protein
MRDWAMSESDSRKKIARLERALARRDATIAQLERALARRDATIARLKAPKPKKAKPPAETSEVAAVKNMIRARGKAVAHEYPARLAQLAAIGEVLREAMAVAVAGQRAHGMTDAQIGGAFTPAITKQAVAQRWPRVSS